MRPEFFSFDLCCIPWEYNLGYMLYLMCIEPAWHRVCSQLMVAIKSWKRMVWKCCIQYASKFGKLSSRHSTGKGQFSLQSQIIAMPRNVQITTQLYSSHTLVKLKISKWHCNSKWTVNFLMFKLDLEKAEEPEIKSPTSTGSWKKQESSRKTSISALLTMPQPLTWWIITNCGKFWKRWEYQTTWPTSWEIWMQVGSNS